MPAHCDGFVAPQIAHTVGFTASTLPQMTNAHPTHSSPGSGLRLMIRTAPMIISVCAHCAFVILGPLPSGDSGHSSLGMTRRYANLVTADLSVVHERVSLLTA